MDAKRDDRQHAPCDLNEAIKASSNDISLQRAPALPALPLPPVSGVESSHDGAFPARQRRRGIVIGSVAGLIATFVSWGIAYADGRFGIVMFLITPCLAGLLGSLTASWRVRQSCAASLGVGLLSPLLPMCLFFVLGFDGLICILMAAPIVLVLGAIGGLIGHFAQPWISKGDSRRGFPLIVPIAMILLSQFAERSLQGAPPVRCVQTTVDIPARADDVWQNVVSFPDLPPTSRWFFQAGIAHPLRARIEGEGVGAVRYCEFSTGPFVEPIRVYDRPRKLAFSVSECPPLMRELSFYDIHPAHLHGYLVSRHGEFELVPIGVGARGGTRLIGRTWYTNAMWPQWYWGLWSDGIIGAIHTEVLNHIRATTSLQISSRTDDQ